MATTTSLFAGRYQLGRLIGQGGMSDVYDAVDTRTDTPVAVKIVRSGDPELARRLAQEVRMMQRMEHPGLIRLLDTGLADGQAYLVMELIDGPTLAASLRSGPLGPRLTAKLGASVASALAHVHEQGIVHRDVKPSNILLSADGRALLGDFGISRFLDASTFTIDGTTLGTVSYMAPEQIEDHVVGPGADMWSLGLVLLECLTGQRVYEGTSSEIIARRLSGPVPLRADLPVAWKVLLSGLLDHRPDQRLAGADVASLLATSAFSAPWSPSSPGATDTVIPTVPHDLTALAEVGASTAVAAAEATMVRTPPPAVAVRPRQTRPWWPKAAGVLVAAVVLGCILYFALHSSTAAPHLAAKTVHHATTTTTTTSTTTTLPSAPSALAALVRDVASGIDAGTLDPDTGQAIDSQAQQAVSDEAAGRPNAAADDLQQVAGTIADAEQSGSLSPDEAGTLQSDLSALASVLGLSAASTPPPATTTTTTVAPPAGLLPGLGRKHGRG